MSSRRGRNSTNAYKVTTKQWTEFITDLYHLAEFCEDEMIPDRLVVGLRNDKHSDKLQIYSGQNIKKKKKQKGVMRSHPGQGNVESLTASIS